MRRRSITTQSRDRPHRRRRALLLLGVLGALLFPAATAAAYYLNPKTQTIRLSSVQDFDRCQKDYESSGSEICLDALKAYVKKHPEDAFTAGKRVRYHFMHWVALDFFVKALGKKGPKDRCADPDVSAAVVSGLALPPHYPAVAQAKKLVDQVCREQLQAPIVAELDGASGYFRSNACPLIEDRELAATRCVADAPKPQPAKLDAVAELKDVDWRKLSIDTESTGALRGTNGEELMFARSKPGDQEYVLLKFKNVRGPWNEQVILAIERPAGMGKEYVTAVNGAEWVILTENQGHYQGFPRDVPTEIFLYPLQPALEAVKLPTRKQIKSEFAAAAGPGK